jgi:hypothetical protein
MKKIIYILIIPFLLAAFENIAAQEMNHSPAAVEKMKLHRIWHKTDNAAGIFLDGAENYT